MDSIDFNLSNAPEYVIENINTTIDLWMERFNLIKKNEIGNYNLHLLLVIPDLHEEIQNNIIFFGKNQYGKKFFETQISSYCNSKKCSELDKLKQEWTIGIKRQLCFVEEALSHNNKAGGRFGLEDILMLIQRIEEKITSENSFEIAIQLLTEKIFQEKPKKELIQFLVDTIILLFNRRGFLDIERLLKYQFEYFEHIVSREGKLYPRLSVTPLEEDKSDEEYREELKSYYENLSIRDRLLFLKEIYCRNPQIYKVIFNTTGITLVNSFSIGDVHFYNPVKDGKYIKEVECLDFENSECCIAVNVQGTDSTSMKIQAKHMAERAIAGLSIRVKREQAITLSDDFVMCDDEGNLKVSSFSRPKPNPVFNKNDTSESQNYYLRLGKWISAGNKCHPTVLKWLTSIELQRQATESSQSSKELLD
jgi:hypothetical protein